MRTVPVGHGHHGLDSALENTASAQESVRFLPSQVAMEWFSTEKRHDAPIRLLFFFWWRSVTTLPPSVSRSTKENNIVSLLTLVLSTGQTFLGRFYSFQTMERSLPAPPALLPRSRPAARLGSERKLLRIEKSGASVLELEDSAWAMV